MVYIAIPTELLNNLSYNDVLIYSHVVLPVFNETVFLIEASENVTLIRIHIENSTGLALAAVSSPIIMHPNNAFFMKNSYPKLRLAHCKISNSRSGSVAIFGTSSLIETTVITNSTTGIISNRADMVMKNMKFVNCLSSHLMKGRAMIRDELTMNQSSLYTYRQNLYAQESYIYFVGGNSQLGLRAVLSKLLIEEKSTILFTKFYLTLHYSYSFSTTYSRMILKNSTMTFTDNTVSGESSASFHIVLSKMGMSNKSSLVFANNSVQAPKGAGFLLDDSSWGMTPDSDFTIKGNVATNGFVVKFVTATVSLNGSVNILNNTVKDFGVFNLFISSVQFQSSLKVVGNRAKSGAISAYSSDFYITHSATFINNHAVNGGAVTLIFSKMHVSSRAPVEFTRNRAHGLGGAIYIYQPSATQGYCELAKIKISLCSIQIIKENPSDVCKFFSFTFNQNKAGIAGNNMYGGLTSACIPCIVDRNNCSNPYVPDVSKFFKSNDSSGLSSFTSDPTRSASVRMAFQTATNF